MLDEIAIQQTLNHYSLYVGRQDWERVISNFVADGIWEVPSMGLKVQGHDAVSATMQGSVAELSYFVQINAPAVITIDGDKATAQSAIREAGKHANRDEALEVLGSYDDELVRTPDGWKFVRRTFVLAGVHNYLLAPAPTSA